MEVSSKERQELLKLKVDSEKLHKARQEALKQRNEFIKSQLH